MPGGFTAEDIANQALDAIGRPQDEIGDLQSGTSAAKVILRAYGECLRQLTRAAHWNHNRKEAPLLLLADASGNTEDVGTIVPQGWIYEYALPDDCLKSRFVPWNMENATAVPSDNIQIPDTPLTTGTGTQRVPFRPRPAKFLEAMVTDNPPPTPPGYQNPNVSPQGRIVILTNVRNATLVYTALSTYPSMWDAGFRAAMVAYLAAEVALPLWAKENPKFGLQMRNEQAEVVRGKVIQARISDGNSGTYTSDLVVDWIQGRFTGGSIYPGWGSGGFMGDSEGWYMNGWDTMSVAGGAVF